MPWLPWLFWEILACIWLKDQCHQLISIMTGSSTCSMGYTEDPIKSILLPSSYLIGTLFSMNAIHDIVYQSRLFFLSFFLAWLHIIYSRGVWPSTYTPLNNLFVPSLSHPLHVAINSDFRFKHQRSSCFTNNGTSTPSPCNAHPLLKRSLKPEHQSLKYPSLLGMDTELNLNTTGSNTLPCVTNLTLLNAGGSKPFNTGGICHSDRSQWTGRVRYKNSFRNINGNEYDLSTSYTHIHKCANMHI